MIILWLILLLGFYLVFDPIVWQTTTTIPQVQIYIELGVGAGAENNPEPEPEHEPDSQNVHDSLVQSHLCKSVKALKQSTELKINKNKTISDLIELVNPHQYGRQAINRIIQCNTPFEKLKMTEIDILQLIWNRINASVNQPIYQTLVDNLILQLTDMVDLKTGNVCCATGRISRLIQCLEGADLEQIVNIKSTWAVKEEIINFFSSYRSKFLSKLPRHYADIYNTIDQSHTEIITKINQRMATGIKKRLVRRYVDTNLVSNKQFDQITKPYFDELVSE